MGPKTELLLYQLYWVLDVAARPMRAFRRHFDCFETWASANGLHRQVQRLESLALLERNGKGLDQVVRLTSRGRRLAQGIRNPETSWRREWDGLWRFVAFDVPEKQARLRLQLRRRLFNRHFGCLQRSVWVSPDPISDVIALVRGTRADPGSLTLFEGSVCGGAKGPEIAGRAWDFDAINAGYRTYLAFLEQWRQAADRETAVMRLAAEKAAWDEAVQRDPLLPACLLPPGYQGVHALRKRRRMLAPLVRALF